MLFYTVTIYANFIVWGIIQERLFDSNILIKFNNVIILLTNIMSIMLMRPSKGDFNLLLKLCLQKKNFKYFAILVITQTMTQPLNYYITSNYGIDYLFLQLSKSCKMIPVIVIHKLIYKRNIDNTKVIISLLITISIVIFNYKPNSSPNLSGMLLLLPLTMEDSPTPHRTSCLRWITWTQKFYWCSIILSILLYIQFTWWCLIKDS